MVLDAMSAGAHAHLAGVHDVMLLHAALLCRCHSADCPLHLKPSKS